ncbi:MAG: phosphatidylcholine synthase [Legionellaceae bacterium]|nr:phosphatidylcholine synthase [Legionellaceae bacterium]
MTLPQPHYHPLRHLGAWMVHLFTASAAIAGLLTLIKIEQGQYVHALWFMGLAVLIDAIDGSFARQLQVKEILPRFDGALLDNIVDYFNYVITPSFFLYHKPDMLPESVGFAVLCLIILTSSYQFCQSDAKTPDHFFKGFPCYWNIVVFYLFIFSSSATTNALVLSILSVLIFVPIKYVYPSRLDYLTNSNLLKILMHMFSGLFGISCAFILWQYPHPSHFWLAISLFYVGLYLSLSFYRSWYPSIKSRLIARKNKAKGLE